MLLPMADGCQEQVKELQTILARILAANEAGFWQFQMKVFAGVHQDRVIADSLLGYVTTVTQKQVTRLGGLELKTTCTIRTGSPRPETRAVSSIHFGKVYGYIDRTGIISELDERVKARRRIAFLGIGGAG